MRNSLDSRFVLLAWMLFLAGCCCCGGGGTYTEDDDWEAVGEDGAEDGGETADASLPPVIVEPGEPSVPPVVRPPVEFPGLVVIVRPSGEPIAGGELNKFFPDSTDELILIYKQEKEGFAQANLSRDAVEVATLSIADLRSNPEAFDKYTASPDVIQGHPVAAMGSKATGLLVGSRFQVSVRSLDDSFSEADRRAWLAKFNLAGLSQLK